MKLAPIFVGIFFLSTLSPFLAFAKYGFPHQEFVPLARVISNLEARLKKDAGNLEVKTHLARAYAMAATVTTEGVDVNAGSDKTGASIAVPPLASAVPGKVTGVGKIDDEVTFSSSLWHQRKKVKDPNDLGGAEIYQREIRLEGTAAAKGKLEKAISLFSEVLKSDATQPLARIGLAWCLEREGKKSEAIVEYRKSFDSSIITAHWTPIGQTLAQESGSYLLALLDPVKDKPEIAEIQKKIATAHQQPGMISPILIPLGRERNLPALVNPRARVKFSLDGKDSDREWGWIRPNAAWLVYDPEGTGKIVSGRQLFGNVTFWIFFENGYAALSALDDDANGFLEGSELSGLSLWRDRNENGISEPGEVKSLRQWGIRKLSTRFQTGKNGIPTSNEGALFRDGWRTTYDWIAKSR